MPSESKKTRWIALAVLASTVLANLPYLPSRVVFIHDTLDKFALFHYCYSHLFFFNELPRWCPILAYGMPADHMLFYLQPTDLLLMLAGRGLEATDALLLFKLAALVLQCIFAFGLFLLCRRNFTCPALWFLIPVGAVL